MRSSAWSAGHDDARRHQHGDAEGSGQCHEGGRCANRALRAEAEMDKKSVRDRIIEIGVVPVVRASSQRDALVAAEAVAEGGIPVVEITMTVPGAVEVIRELAKSNSSGVLIGAGTVLDAESARRCRDAGAQFLVSPALNVETIEFAVKESML